MNKLDIIKQINEKYNEIAELRKAQIAIAKENGLEEVENYTFKTPEGKEIKMKELFGDFDELILIHNMGKSCSHCTLWADGLSSSYRYFKTLCGFALTSPDSPEVLVEFGKDRKWEFPYYSAHGSGFTADMGFSFLNDKGSTSYYPGYTTFLLKDDKIYRVACDTFGPGDFYSPIFHFIEMLYHPDRDWRPNYNK